MEESVLAAGSQDVSGSARIPLADRLRGIRCQPVDVGSGDGIHQNQREHHRRQTFEEEFIAFLERHRVEYDPEYAWD